METTTLTVTFPQEKLEALQFYMGEKGQTVEEELQNYVGVIYEKSVPSATRRFLDRNDEPNENAKNIEPPKGEKPTANMDKKLTKKQKKEQEQQIPNSPKQADDPEPEVEEVQGLTMSM